MVVETIEAEASKESKASEHSDGLRLDPLIEEILSITEELPVDTPEIKG
jgi:hypothetical protein